MGFNLCCSANVTDQGVKSLCLKHPENHTQRSGCQLHELRVRSFHLNPCCTSLKEVTIIITRWYSYLVSVGRSGSSLARCRIGDRIQERKPAGVAGRLIFISFASGNTNAVGAFCGRVPHSGNKCAIFLSFFTLAIYSLTCTLIFHRKRGL